MHKHILSTFLILFSITLTGCNIFEAKPKLSIEMIAFNSLTKKEQDLIIASPKDSEVEQIKVTKHIKSLMNKKYEEDKVYSVVFNHTETDSAGNLTVYVALDKETVVGKGFASK